MEALKVYQLTTNMDFMGSDPSDSGPHYIIPTSEVSLNLIIDELVEKRLQEKVVNVSFSCPDDDHYVLSFYWAGDEPGVVIFEIYHEETEWDE